MAEKPSKIKIEAWAAMVHLTQSALNEIEQRLSEKGLISLTWYDVLYAVYSSPNGRLRLSDLVDEVILSKSALSRSVDKIVGSGLLKKAASADDGRVSWLEVTPSGRDALRACWEVYGSGIEQHFARHYSEKEARTLRDLHRRGIARREA